MSDVAVYAAMEWLRRHARAHLLIFEARDPASYSSATGLRLLAVFVILEGLVGPRRASPVLMLAAALLMIRYVGRVRLSQIGLHSWRRWTASEKSFFVQMVPLAILIFGFVTESRLRAIALDETLWVPAASMLPWYLAWGIYQEVMYRGILQTELGRRFGPVAGILTANVAYTFGPLHAYYLSAYQPPTLYAMFAAVFAIGLYFGLLFLRSGNLLIVGTLHGIGDVFLSGLPRLR